MGRPIAGAQPIIGSCYLLAIYLLLSLLFSRERATSGLHLTATLPLVPGFHLDQPIVCQKSMRGDLRV